MKIKESKKKGETLSKELKEKDDALADIYAKLREMPELMNKLDEKTKEILTKISSKA